MCLLYIQLLWLLLFIVSSCSYAAKILPITFTKTGNIYYAQDGLNSLQLTNSGKDQSPVLSSNKKMIAFIREGKEKIPSGCPDFADTGSAYGKQVWIYDIDRKQERLLVANNFLCSKPAVEIVDPNSPLFSPDDKTLYFLTSAWATSGALHAVNVDGTNQRFIAPANSSEVITRGQYKGYLIVQQHRYFIGGGTYDWFWLLTPQGKDEGPLGEEISSDQRAFFEMD